MKKLLYIPYGILLFLDWWLTLLSNLLEVICKAIAELSLYLENIIKADGKAKPTVPTDTTGNPAA